jgi:flagellar hook assembly protein FlgD
MLAAGAKMTVAIKYSPNGSSGQSDQLVIGSNSTIAQNVISFKGVNTPAAASVSNDVPAGVTLTVSPNPMSSQLTVALTGVRSTNISVYDLSGKLVRTASTSASSWMWDGSANDGTVMMSGTYFVRISSIGTDGTPFVATRKVVLAR